MLSNVKTVRTIFIAVCGLCLCLAVAPLGAQDLFEFNPTAPQAESLELNPNQMIAEGWTEEYPGVWTQEKENGERRLRARGREALGYVLQKLERKAAALMEAELLSPSNTARLNQTLTMITDIEAGLTRARPPHPQCFRSASVSASANPGPNCGVSASASASVTSNAWCETTCHIYSDTYAESACSASGPVSGPSAWCDKDVMTDTCNSYSQSDKPFRCESAAGASVYCGAEDYISIADYEDTIDQGTGCQVFGRCSC